MLGGEGFTTYSLTSIHIIKCSRLACEAFGASILPVISAVPWSINFLAIISPDKGSRCAIAALAATRPMGCCLDFPAVTVMVAHEITMEIMWLCLLFGYTSSNCC